MSNKYCNHSRVWYSFVNSYEWLINPALVPCLNLHKCSNDGVFTASWKKYTALPQNSLEGKQYINVSYSFPSKLLPIATQHWILYISLKTTASCHTKLQIIFLKWSDRTNTSFNDGKNTPLCQKTLNLGIEGTDHQVCINNKD